MNIPDDIIIKAAAAEIANRMESANADLQLFTMQQVADRLNVSKSTAIRLCKEVVELGETSRRVSASQLRKLIENRTITA